MPLHMCRERNAYQVDLRWSSIDVAFLLLLFRVEQEYSPVVAPFLRRARQETKRHGHEGKGVVLGGETYSYCLTEFGLYLLREILLYKEFDCKGVRILEDWLE